MHLNTIEERVFFLLNGLKMYSHFTYSFAMQLNAKLIQFKSSTRHPPMKCTSFSFVFVYDLFFHLTSPNFFPNFQLSLTKMDKNQRSVAASRTDLNKC